MERKARTEEGLFFFWRVTEGKRVKNLGFSVFSLVFFFEHRKVFCLGEEIKKKRKEIWLATFRSSFV